MDKSLKKLSRIELLEVMVNLSEAYEEQLNENKLLRKELSNQRRSMREAQRLPRAGKAGSIAEAALQANGYFEAAQRSADDYLREIKRLHDEFVQRNEIQAARQAADEAARQAAAKAAQSDGLQHAQLAAQPVADDVPASDSAVQEAAQVDFATVQALKRQAREAQLQAQQADELAREAQRARAQAQHQVHQAQRQAQAVLDQAQKAQQEALQAQRERAQAEAQARQIEHEARTCLRDARRQAAQIVETAKLQADAIVAQAKASATAGAAVKGGSAAIAPAGEGGAGRASGQPGDDSGQPAARLQKAASPSTTAEIIIRSRHGRPGSGGSL